MVLAYKQGRQRDDHLNSAMYFFRKLKTTNIFHKESEIAFNYKITTASHDVQETRVQF